MQTIGTERLAAAKAELDSRDRTVAVLRDDGQKVTLAAAAQGSDKRTFRMLAYSGAEIARWYGRLAIDLNGIEADESVAVLYEHNDLKPVAVATKRTVDAKGLVLEGHMLSNAQAKEIAQNADEGLPYRCSIGIRILHTEELAEGAEIQLNGRAMKGPLTIARRSRLFECSFITCDPADPNTAAEVMHREGQMADLKDAPASTELLRAEAQKAARAELAKRAEELRAAFPDRVEFANDCALKGLTVIEAKALLSDKLAGELKAERDAKTKTSNELETLKKQARTPGLGFAGPQRESLVAEVVDYSPVERAKAEWHGQPIVRAAFPDFAGAQYSGVERYAAWLRLEERLKVEPTAAGAAFGGHAKAIAVLKRIADVLEPSIRATAGMGERLSSWGKSGPDYADFTVKGYLGMLYRPLEDVLGLSWGPRLGVMIPSNQETETYRFFGQVPQLREWLGSRQYAPLAKYAFSVTNKLYEASLLVAIADFLFEKSGQLQIRFGELGRRAAGHWEKLVSSLITTNGLAYDGVAFFSASHTLGGASGTMKNTFVAADVPSLNVAISSAPTAEEFAKALVEVTAQFFNYLDDKGEPINGDARKFVLMVPTNLWPAALAAIRLNRLNSGSENQVRVQEMTWDVVPNPRLNSNPTKFYVFREDSAFKPFVLQEATGVELEFQGAGTQLAFEQDAYAFGLKVRRAAAYGEWAHAIEATFS